MLNIANNIFNRKLLDTVIQNFDFSNIEDLKQKEDILLNWKSTIESNVLKKAGEIALHGDFLADIFSKVLDYKKITQNHNEWNLTHEQKTKQDATRADGALGFFTPTLKDIRGIIEFKSSATDLDSKQKGTYEKISPVDQAFRYRHKSGKKCRWVIVSNYLELRLYNAKSSLKKAELPNLLKADLSKAFTLS